MTDDLDGLPTDELRRRAFRLAEHRIDVGFFWDLLEHLPAAEGIAAEDGSAGNVGQGISDLIEAVRELSGRGVGDLEPMLRARFLEYLRAHRPE